MKFFSRLGIYKSSNVTFDPKEVQAHSYAWWMFVTNINGKIVFNNYRYSSSTGKHQSKVRSLLNELDIPIDYIVSCRSSLNSTDWQEQALKNLDDIILESSTKLANPRRKKALDDSRLQYLNAITQDRHDLQEFINTLKD